MQRSAPDAAAWWSRPLAELLRELGAPAHGLSTTAARERLKRHGANAFRDRPERPVLVQFLARFRNPLVMILVAASLVSALTGETASFVIITVMVLASVTLDFVQEYRASQAAQRLRRSVQVRATIVRDGEPKSIAVSHVVPGDVALLAAGSLVPGDGILLESRDLHVDQALLTGESFPVEKHVQAPAPSQVALADASNALFMGTSIVSGTARLLVCRTGERTAIGQIAGALAREPPPTAFDLGTRRFGMLIMRLTVLMVLFVLLMNTLTHKPWLESFLFAIALAVGLTPELLPMIVSVTLARGALRMAGKRVIVKRLAAIENLGSMDVLCTDKTGTLTEASITLESHLDSDGRDSPRVLLLAHVNSRFETGIRSPLDQAILGHEGLDVGAWTKIDEAPFDFERRRVSVLADDGETRLLIVKGAPEDILRLSTRYEAGGPQDVQPFDAAARARAARQLDAQCANGLRVLAVAIRTLPRERDRVAASDESDLVFVGFLTFVDPPKASAARAIAALRAAGVAVKILTGDHELVTQHVCAKLGVPVEGVLTGDEIARLDDHALSARALEANLFCRVNPAQKNRVIQALRRRGRVVGFLGDGVNDAPALHSADVGLSVDTAVDVAKEAADLILLRHDLHALHDGVVEGRRTFANIRKYILMGTSSNFGNMFSMAGASIFLPFLPMLPAQILLNNILYDLSEIAIPLDDVDAEELAHPQAWDMAFVRNFMWVMGPVSSLFDFATFYVLLAVLNADEALFQTGWFVESLATQVIVIFVIRTRRNPLASRPHPALVASSVAVVLAALVLPFTAVGRYFAMQAPPPAFYAILGALVVGYLVLAEAAKRFFYARFAPRHA
ncbi:MAG TPA: magnesium-translocating P-type ATPase [Casimicrobiaceae bacterium]